MKAGQAEMVKRVEVARFLGVDAEEVQRMEEMDDLPVVRTPGMMRPRVRVYLRSLHRWLVDQNPHEEGLKDFDEFRRAFFRSQKQEKEVAA